MKAPVFEDMLYEALMPPPSVVSATTEAPQQDDLEKLKSMSATEWCEGIRKMELEDAPSPYELTYVHLRELIGRIQDKFNMVAASCFNSTSLGTKAKTVHYQFPAATETDEAGRPTMKKVTVLQTAGEGCVLDYWGKVVDWTVGCLMPPASSLPIAVYEVIAGARKDR